MRYADQRTKWRNGIVALSLALGLGSLVPVRAQGVPAGYAEWKAQASGAAEAASRADFTVENTYMKITVNTAAAQYGMFGLATLAGDPATATDDNRILIYGTSGSTSGLGVKIDGTVTSLKNTAPSQASTKSEDNTYSTTEWVVSGVLIRQRLELVDSGNGRADTAKMTYSLTNQGQAAKTVGLKVGIDTMIGSNDAAPIALASGIVTGETGYGQNGLPAGGSYTNSVPDYWQAFEVNNIATPGLVARGTLVGGGATKPDKFVAGQWRSAGSGVSDSSTFDYQPTGSSYGDSAVGIWWLDRSLGVGQTLTFVTFYGLGSVTGVGGNLSLSVTSPASLAADGADFDPNPFTVNAIVQNTTGAAMAPVTVTLILPPGLSLPGLQSMEQTIPTLAANSQQLVSWQVLADTANAGQTLTFSVDAVGGGNTPHVDRSVILPALQGGGDGDFVNVLAVGHQPNSVFPEITAKVFVDTDAGWHCQLTAANFSLKEDDVAQVIDSVTCAGSAAASTDIVFVFDDTGSMDSYIATLKDKATEFADSIVAAHVDARFGLVSFKDEAELDLQLTASVPDFQTAVDALFADAGDDEPESSLDAVMMALNQMQWRAGAQRVIVLITDASANYRGDGTDLSSYIMSEVVTAIRNAAATMLVVSTDFSIATRGGQVGNDGKSVRGTRAAATDSDVKLLASETGGLWSDIATADFSAFIDRVANIVTSTYTVLYHTSNAVADGTLRNVVVTVVDPVAGTDSDDGTYTAPLAATVVMTTAVTGSGTVNPPAGLHTVSKNVAQSISATAATGWHFVNWTKTASATLGSASAINTTATLSADATVTANFLINQYAITFTALTGGTLQGTANQTINHGASATAVKALASTGYRFVNWTRDDSSEYSTSDTVTVTNVTAALHLTANFQKLLPDFIVTEIVLDPASPGVGSTFTAYIRVKNQGLLAGKIGSLGVWLNRPGADVPAKTVADKTAQSSVMLRPGQTMILVVTGLSAGATSGQKTFRAFADSTNGTAEGREDNNQMTQLYTVAVADFIVTEVELTPDYTDAGKTFTAYVNVKNNGVVPGDAGTLDVWANRSSAPAPAITVKGDKSVVVGILAAGQEKRFAVIGLSAPKLSTGQTQVSCRLQALIDGRAKTLETDETNNARAFDYLAK